MSSAAQARSERYSDEQIAFGQEVRRFLAKQQPVSRVRELSDDSTGRDAELWRRAASELDILGLMVPEKLGGSGFGFAEASLVLVAAGESLTSWPYLSSAVLATHCLLASGDEEAMRRWLPGMARGETVAAVALADDAGSWALDNASARAAAGADGSWTVAGTKSFVADGQLADVLLVFAESGPGTGIFAVRTDAPGVEIVPLPALDSTRKLSRVAFADVPAEPVGSTETTGRVHATLLTLAAAALACEASGGIAAVLDITTRYAKMRRQFGRTIGSFQSIKHRCAEIYMRSEAAAAFAESIALAVDSALRDEALGESVTEVDAATAALFCCDGFVRSAQDMIQVHGGIGFTWEHDAHLFLRRAASDARFFGGRSRHLAVLTQAMRSGPLLARTGAAAPGTEGGSR